MTCYKKLIFILKRIPSQFILYKDNSNLEENFHASSILKKMIVKTKGEPYKILFNSKFLTNNFMFIDIDSKTIKEGIQYCISSLYNKNFNKYYTNIKIRKNNEKIFYYLMKLAINQHQYANINKYPNAFIVYIKPLYYLQRLLYHALVVGAEYF